MAKLHIIYIEKIHKIRNYTRLHHYQNKHYTLNTKMHTITLNKINKKNIAHKNVM